jgi:tight adherence protein C
MGSTFFLGLLTFVVVVGFCLLLMQPVFAQYVDTYAVRVRTRAKEKDAESADQPKDSATLVLLRTIGELVLSLMPALADKRSVQFLREANYRTPAHLAIYTGIKTVIVGVVLLLGLVSSGNMFSLMLCVPAAAIGWIMPNFFLAGRVNKRKDAILSELPTVIDLLIVCAQAGLGLLMAVDKVSRETGDSCPILAVELGQLINDVKVFAKSVPVALRDMGERCGVSELISMSSALIAAEAKGADMSYPLRQQGEALRDRLKRKKEEQAAKVPVKMVPVIMVFVMPLILAPMLGPAVFTLTTALGPLMGGVK